MSIALAEARIASAIESRSETLDLRGLGLKALPPLLGELSWLRSLELGSNRLTELPGALFTLRELRRLGLGNNRLGALEMPITELRALVSLDLSENRLQFVPSWIGSLERLREVSLYANRLVEVPGALFTLRCLERVDVSGNRLGGLPSLLDCRLSRLSALDASNNRLLELPAGMNRLRALRTLDLSRNQLTSIESLAGLALLENLDVSRNAVRSVLPALRTLPRLVRLDASFNPIADAERAETARFDDRRAQAHAVVEQHVTGGESQREDAHFFNQAPYHFNFDLAVGNASGPRLVDLYYKRLGGQELVLALPDGKRINLGSVSRTKALEFAGAARGDGAPVRLQLGQVHGDDPMRERQAFIVDALTRIDDARIVPPGETVQIDAPARDRHDALLQWSDRPPTADTPGRKVNVGFATDDAPERALSEEAPLPCGAWVWLWFTVSAEQAVPGAIGGGQPLAPSVADLAELDVAVFANRGGFELQTASGTVSLVGAACFVLRPADVPAQLDDEALAHRLYFRVKTPATPVREQLRVHLYHRGLLVQALNILAQVGVAAAADPTLRVMEVANDYTLSDTLDQRQLGALGEHTVSIFANDSPEQQAGFRFYGDGGVINGSATIESAKIGPLLEKARKALREVSWGSSDAYDPGKHIYRYDPLERKPDLKADLVRLAKCGFEIWDVLTKNFAGDGDVQALAAAMRRPGVVQLGLKESSANLLPLAILYDRPIEPLLKNLDAFSLCSAYWDGTACLEGRCPNHGNPRVVCPSGFWGFRHAIGVPIGVAHFDATAAVAPSQIRLFASAYAGENPPRAFRMRDMHLEKLEETVGPARFTKALTCDDTVKRMQQGGFQVLYFYCHGGVEDAVPYVLVGRDDEDPNQIGRATLRASAIAWTAPRSLVFINGCHTTAMEPEQAIDLVNGFIETAHASGVVGTEVTVFEPLATRMGELFVAELFAGRDVGTALRDARRELLRGDRPNPLGLVYIPFALATLKVK